MGHLNGILAQVGGNLNNNFRKSQMPGGLPGGGRGGELKLQVGRSRGYMLHVWVRDSVQAFGAGKTS